MKIVLVCAAGASTSLMMARMKKFAKEGDVIEAFPFSKLEEIIDGYDVVLVGPQLRYKLGEAQKISEGRGKKCGLIDSRDYGMMDGEKVYNFAVNL